MMIKPKCFYPIDILKVNVQNVNPISVVTNTPPITKETEHFFFKLSNYNDFLKEWISNETTQPEIRNKLSEWLSEGLADWDITRDKPYFGFNIPDTKDKYFYVWLDAPVGYIASFKNYCMKHKINFDEFWNKDSTTELYHFIGKDIAYFHALFWPAMLEGANFRKPNAVYCHGFLTIDGEKMSKSRGTFFNVRLISSLADKINKYLDTEKPWVKIKNNDDRVLVQKICTDGLNLFRILIGYLKPILPNISVKVEDILLCEPVSWANLDQLLLNKKINKFKPIIKRIEDKDIKSMKNFNKGEK